MLGYLDDVIIIPAGIWLVLKLIPETLMAEFRVEAERRADQPTSRAGAILIVMTWIGLAAAALWLARGWLTVLSR